MAGYQLRESNHNAEIIRMRKGNSYFPDDETARAGWNLSDKKTICG